LIFVVLSNELVLNLFQTTIIIFIILSIESIYVVNIEKKTREYLQLLTVSSLYATIFFLFFVLIKSFSS